MPCVGLNTSAPGIRADAMPVLIAATTQADAKTAGIRRLRKGMARPCPGAGEIHREAAPNRLPALAPLVAASKAGFMKQYKRNKRHKFPRPTLGRCRRLETAAPA